jgi:cytochrome c-type biogenesis protein
VTVQLLAVGLAFAAGLVSFASPCVLPLVPAYGAYLSGRASLASRPRADTVLAGGAFVAGLSLVFILLFYLLRQALQPVRPYVVPLAGVAVLLLAANMAGLLRLPLPQRELRLMRGAPGARGPLGGFLLGVGFATGWTPCIGVTLGAVLSASALSGATLTGFLQIVAYCVGLGMPFIGIALLLGRALPALRALSRRRRAIDWGSAGILAAMGVLLMTNNLTWITQRLTERLPSGLLRPLGL